MLTYWQLVEVSVLAHLPSLITSEEMGRLVVVQRSEGEERFAVEGLPQNVHF